MEVNLRDLLISVTLSDELTTVYAGLLTLSTLLLLELTELQRIEQLQMFLQLRTAIGGTWDEHVCDGPDVVQTKDLRDKTGDIVSELKIPSDWRGNIYALEVHTNIFFKQQLINCVRKGYSLAISFSGLYGYINWC